MAWLTGTLFPFDEWDAVDDTDSTAGDWHRSQSRVLITVSSHTATCGAVYQTSQQYRDASAETRRLQQSYRERDWLRSIWAVARWVYALTLMYTVHRWWLVILTIRSRRYPKWLLPHPT